jgi:alpha-1,4-galacturonosyltransferase
MRSITISSSSNNGFIDLMKIKVAARHISYRTLFHTILILAFLLPFVFILTALVTLEGVNKCSSFGEFFFFWLLLVFKDFCVQVSGLFFGYFDCDCFFMWWMDLHLIWVVIAF